MQDEIHDQRTVDFSKVCYGAMNRSNEKIVKRKLRHSRFFELEKKRANKLYIIVCEECCVIGTQIRLIFISFQFGVIIV